MINHLKRITAPLITVQLCYIPWGSSKLIVDNYLLNEYEFRQLQLDYATGINLEGYNLIEIRWEAGESSGTIHADGSLSEPMQEGYIDIADKIALELFMLKNKRAQERNEYALS